MEIYGDDNPLNYNFSAFDIAGIYYIKCPLTKNIFYVGKTNDLRGRKQYHLNGNQGGSVGEYERYLTSNGHEPIFQVLEYVFIPFIGNLNEKRHRQEYMSSMEVYWIHQIRAWGFKLLNKDFMKPPKKFTRNHFNYQYASKTNIKQPVI